MLRHKSKGTIFQPLGGWYNLGPILPTQNNNSRQNVEIFV